MADLSKIKLNGTNYNFKDAVARPLVIDAEWLGRSWEINHDRIGKCFSLSVNFDEFQTAVTENKRIILRFYNNTGNDNFYFSNDYYPHTFFNINVDLWYYQNTTELNTSFAGFADILGQWFTIYITYSDNTTGDLEIDYYDDIAMHNDIPSNLSSFYNDVGYLTSYTETDPTVPAWAKAATKPTYTAAEVGALTQDDLDDFQESYTASLAEVAFSGRFEDLYEAPDMADYLQTTDVANWAKAANKPTYTANEVGALPSSTTYVSSFNGNSGAITYTAPVLSVNGATGTVALTASDVGALPDSTDLSGYMVKDTDYVTAGKLSGTILGNKATAEGQNTQSSATASHAEGASTVANKSYAHAEGWQTTASGTASHAEGRSTSATGQYSHAEGWQTTASGNYSHAEGYLTIASGSNAHAEGNVTTAYGTFSHAEGEHTMANRYCQHVFGEYNIIDTQGSSSGSYGKYIEIVGNGDDEDRSNARTLDWDGNEWLAGTLTVSSAPTTAYHVATKQYVDNKNTIKTTASSINTEYNLIGTASSNSNTSAVSIYNQDLLSFAKTNDLSRLTIGSTATPGVVRIYTSTNGASGFTDLKSAASGTTERTITLPDANGTVALTTDIPSVPSWALNSTKPSYAFSELTSHPTTLNDYGITDAYTKTEVDGLVSGVLHYKGTKTTTSALPASGNITGDVWHVTADGSEWAWDGSAWQELGTATDLSGYLQTGDIAAWAKAANKPTYTANEVGALPSSTTYVSSFNGNSGAITYTAPVTSVNEQTGAVTITAANISAAASDHTHGSITNAGAITANTALASSDRLVFADNSDSGKLKRSSITFGSSTAQYLANNGTWQNVPAAVSVSNTLSSGTLIATINGTNIYAPAYTDADGVSY